MVSSEQLQLPIDAILPDVLASLASCPRLVIEAPPGAGKTTRVPPALLRLVSGDVVVLEPRRIAARLAARRVAAELGETPGGLVGYQVRFEEAIGPRTRLLFVTEGVLTRRLLSNPDLRGVDTVILDEFHERHVDSDLALALLKKLQCRRPELRLIVMSATLDAAPIARYLDNCPVLRSEGRLYPLTIRHMPYSPQLLELQVRDAAEFLLREGETGNVLVFLPGAAEIRRCMRACEAFAQKLELLLYPLHGDLSPEDQDKAIAASPHQKIIFATNVAESSITVEGVTAVIDSGLARVATHSPWTGLPTLHIARVSRASARQRSGRAGRTAPGRVLRLYTEEDYHARPHFDAPEIVRTDLAQLLLTLRAMRMEESSAIDWLDAPPPAAVQTADLLLDRLDATEGKAQQLAKFPLPPRLARLLLEGMKRNVGEDACVAAALLGAGTNAMSHDLLTAIETRPDARLQQHIAQIRRIALPARQPQHNDDELLKAVLTSFPDRVARRRTGSQALLSNGGSAEFAGEAPQYEFMVAVDAEDRKEKPLPIIRMTARIEPEWLIELFPDRVTEQSSLEWNRSAERVESLDAILYDALVIQHSRNEAPESEAAAEFFLSRAIEAGIGRFTDEAALKELTARLEFAGMESPDSTQIIRELCQGIYSFAELKLAATDLLSRLKQKAGPHHLDTLAPDIIRLKSGKSLKVHYQQDKPPWIASRLQDFFGMHEAPRLGVARIPIVIHLLAPNQRPIQMTSDLAGFWERLYPQIRRELMRRYPRHKWPERPNESISMEQKH